MRITITLANYRCFGSARPVRLELDRGLVALVGPNNAGKSTLLRFFYELRPLLMNLRNDGTRLALVNNHWRMGLGGPEGVEDPVEVLSDLDRSLPLSIEIRWQVDEEAACSGVRLKYHADTICDVQLLIGPEGKTCDLTLNPSQEIIADKRKLGFREMNEFFTFLERAVYVPPYRNAVNEGKGKYYSWDIGTAFIEKWNTWATSGNKANSQAIQSVTKEIGQIFGYGSLSINASEDRRTFQIFADGRSYRLREKGAGLAQFIMVLGNLAMLRPSMVLIDEPELNLHSLMQANFLEAIAKYSTHGVMFATHSLGLARLADKIYSVTRAADGYSDFRPFEKTTNVGAFLGEMGFAGFRDLGYRTVVAVEGRTDTKPVRALLRKLRKDHEAVVLPLHGTNMIANDREHELAELRRLADHVCVLIDSERTHEGDDIGERIVGFMEKCQALGIRVHATDRRALENYFTQRAVSAVLGSERRALAPYEKLNSREHNWSKRDNWRIAGEMTVEEVLQSDVGQFLNSI